MSEVYHIFDDFQERNWSVNNVKVVSDDSGCYGVARFHPYVPDSALPSRKACDLLAIASLMRGHPSDEIRDALAAAFVESRDLRKLEEKLT